MATEKNISVTSWCLPKKVNFRPWGTWTCTVVNLDKMRPERVKEKNNNNNNNSVYMYMYTVNCQIVIHVACFSFSPTYCTHIFVINLWLLPTKNAITSYVLSFTMDWKSRTSQYIYSILTMYYVQGKMPQITVEAYCYVIITCDWVIMPAISVNIMDIYLWFV